MSLKTPTIKPKAKPQKESLFFNSLGLCLTLERVFEQMNSLISALSLGLIIFNVKFFDYSECNKDQLSQYSISNLNEFLNEKCAGKDPIYNTIHIKVLLVSLVAFANKWLEKLAFKSTPMNELVEKVRKETDNLQNIEIMEENVRQILLTTKFELNVIIKIISASVAKSLLSIFVLIAVYYLAEDSIFDSTKFFSMIKTMVAIKGDFTKLPEPYNLIQPCYGKFDWVNRSEFEGTHTYDIDCMRIRMPIFYTVLAYNEIFLFFAAIVHLLSTLVTIIILASQNSISHAVTDYTAKKYLPKIGFTRFNDDIILNMFNQDNNKF